MLPHRPWTACAYVQSGHAAKPKALFRSRVGAAALERDVVLAGTSHCERVRDVAWNSVAFFVSTASSWRLLVAGRGRIDYELHWHTHPTDQIGYRGNGACFDLKYDSVRAGRVGKLSARSSGRAAFGLRHHWDWRTGFLLHTPLLFSRSHTTTHQRHLSKGGFGS